MKNRKSYIPKYIQRSVFDGLDEVQATSLRDTGIKMAVEHADAKEPSWSQRAYDFLIKKFLMNHNGPFMVEEFRSYCAQMDFPLPPHARAFGAVIMRAAKENVVEKVGTQNTRNPKSHRTPATVWRQVKAKGL
jgi:hypothetical protein